MDHLLHYGVHLKQRGLATSTIKERFSALSFAAKSLGFTDFMGDFRVQKMLEGWKREEVPCQDPHQPLSSKILIGLYKAWGTVCASDFEVALFHAAALVAFFFLALLKLVNWWPPLRGTLPRVPSFLVMLSRGRILC